jgi:uncharacterized membrane protein YphA (DoxX/SURF4 family)
MVGYLNQAIILFSALSFLIYGTGCFTSRHLQREFQRFGFSDQRKLIGFLQICGALALVCGFWIPLLGKAGAAGLAVMMFVAIIVRIRIQDSFPKTVPAILYCALNTYLTVVV